MKLFLKVIIFRCLIFIYENEKRNEHKWLRASAANGKLKQDTQKLLMTYDVTYDIAIGYISSLLRFMGEGGPRVSTPPPTFPLSRQATCSHIQHFKYWSIWIALIAYLNSNLRIDCLSLLKLHYAEYKII